jgi:hypothetical protein
LCRAKWELTVRRRQLLFVTEEQAELHDAQTALTGTIPAAALAAAGRCATCSQSFVLGPRRRISSTLSGRPLPVLAVGAQRAQPTEDPGVLRVIAITLAEHGAPSVARLLVWVGEALPLSGRWSLRHGLELAAGGGASRRADAGGCSGAAV